MEVHRNGCTSRDSYGIERDEIKVTGPTISEFREREGDGPRICSFLLMARLAARPPLSEFD